jgi:predicted phage tail protein
VNARSVAVHASIEEREDASFLSCASDVASLSITPTALGFGMYGYWCMVYGVWFMVCGLWFMVGGWWFMVGGWWLVVGSL